MSLVQYMSRPAVLAVGFLSLLSATPAVAFSRGDGVECVRNHYNLGPAVADASAITPEEENGEDDLLGVAEEQAEADVEQIGLSIGILFKVRAVPCSDADNAHAYFSKENDNLPEDYTNQHYILYNKTWLSDNMKAGEVELNFILGHELGHLTNHHETSRSNIDVIQKELEADYMGGCAVGRMKMTWPPVEALIRRIRQPVSEVYGKRVNSLAWAKTGFTNCDGIINPGGVRVLYFKKEEDKGAVEKTLTSTNIQYETASSTLDMPSNGITCTSDFDFKIVKDIAVDLVNAGVGIVWINKAMRELNAKKRITVEAYETERITFLEPFTEEQILCMTKCESWHSDEDPCDDDF